MKNAIKTAILIAAAAACFIVGMALRGGGASAQAQGATVATVDVPYLLENFTETSAANQKLETLKIKMEDDLKSKIVAQFGTTDFSQLDDQHRLDAERVMEEADKGFRTQADSIRVAEWEPAVQKVLKKIEQTATAKGFEVVLSKEAVLFGGADITEEVLGGLNGK